jgi:pyridoxal phosphate enzyme (YggS family)
MHYINWVNRYPQIHRLIAVSKTRSIEEIEKLVKQGFNDFGENRVDELALKAEHFSSVYWHFIGHIQSNKIKDIVRYADWIHSVENVRQIGVIEQYATFYGKHINVLLQLNLTKELQKSGMDVKDIDECLNALMTCKYTHLKGFMVMGPSDVDHIRTEACFKQAYTLFNHYRDNNSQIEELSMGMSQDYQVAYQYGSTMFRLGTVLFKTKSSKF